MLFRLTGKGGDGTQDSPFEMGAVTITGEDFPVSTRPYPTFYLEHDGVRKTAGLMSWPETVYNNVPPTSFSMQLNLKETNAFSTVSVPVKLVVELSIRRKYDEPELDSRRLEAWIWTRKQQEPETLQLPGPVQADRYRYLENDYVRLEFDLRSGGAISRLFCPASSSFSWVDNRDDGRLIQTDFQLTGVKATNYDKNPWTDIPHRDVYMPTQGGSVWHDANWVQSHSIASDAFTCEAAMPDFWGVGPNGETKPQYTPYKVLWRVRLIGPVIHINSEIVGPRIPDLMNIWWFAKGFDFIDGEPRWGSNRAFRDAKVLSVYPTDRSRWVNLFTAAGRMIAFWLVSDVTGAGANVDQAPEGAISAHLGVRNWATNKVDLQIDCTHLAEAVTPEPQLPPDILRKIEAMIEALYWYAPGTAGYRQTFDRKVNGQ